MAILAVIVQHSLSRPSFAAIGGPLYILSAVGMFMVIAGYNSAQSYGRRQISSIAQGYRWDLISKAIMRLLVPYLAVWLLEALLVLHGPALSSEGYLAALLGGGWGWGSYFIPIIICHTLLFPLIYRLAQRAIALLLPVAFALDMAFELFSYHLGLPNAVHEAIYLRYLFAVALGAWLAMARPRRRWIVLLAIAGGIYIAALEYGGLVLPMNMAWASRAAPSFGYDLGFVVLGLLLLPARSSRRFWRLLGGIGRASYHVFLIQGVFFWRLYSPPPPLPEYIGTSVALLVLAVAGWALYRADGFVLSALTPAKERRFVPRASTQSYQRPSDA